MVQQNVVPPQFFEQILRLRRKPQLARRKWTILQIRTLHVCS
jgi:hypothetical protein